MDHEATINVRLSVSLKRSGTAVLERNGVSPTQLVRSVYRYLDREQRIPECLDINPDAAQKRRDARRAVARSVAGSIHLQGDLDTKTLRADRIEQKYGSVQ